MNSKKKIIIAVSAFALVLLATIVSVVAVLAAQNVTVRNTITIQYTVVDVVADIEVYAVKVEKDATTINWGTAKKAVFGVDGFDLSSSTGFTEYGTTTDENSAAETSFDKFDISKKECVVLKFVFKNNSASRAFTADLTIDGSDSNVSIAHSSGNVVKPGDITGTNSQVTVAKSGTTGDTVSYFVKLSIVDATKNVDEFTPVFEWALALAS